jgi:hypothetical protein
MKYLVKSTDVYRVQTVEEVEKLHEELKDDSHFTLAAFSYQTKVVKSKGEIIDEYQLVTVKKLFNEEKEPDTNIEIIYEVN